VIGQKLGPYEIVGKLGHGGMGEVYAARDTRLDRSVAIKVVSEAFARRFEREGRALAAINHPNICTIYDVGPNYLVMELLDGQTLGQVLEAGPLSIADAVRYGGQIAAALAAAHAHGIVHRDLKPGNIMVASGTIKVLDFGIATHWHPAEPHAETVSMTTPGITLEGQMVGTPQYMSPEQAEGRPVDVRSDVFAFGIVLYEMVCGRRPFRGDTALAMLAATLQATPKPPRQLRHDVPAPLEQLILRCLEKSPDARFSSGGTLHDAFRALDQRASSSKVAVPRVALIAAVFVAVVAGAVWMWQSYQNAERARWVETAAVPEIARLVQADRTLEARRLYQEAERASPNSRSLFKLAEGVAPQPVRFETDPPGAQIYVTDYAAGAGDDLASWQLLGAAPITFAEAPHWGFFRIRAVKTGFATTEQTLGGAQSVRIVLHPQDTVPAGMVYAPATVATAPPPVVSLPAFWIDRYEVTNGDFKKFVDAGGYQKPEYWTNTFVKEGKTLSWREAMAEFRDATGRPGPATWQLGSYPEGAGSLPVSGVSWYEAAAYAAFAGKSLPSVHEWRHASGIGFNSNILQLSNFNGKALAKPGQFRGMGPFGTFDTAGNVKEWTMNAAQTGERYILGGAWNEAAYVFSSWDARPPFARDETFGFRCVTRTAALPDGAAGPLALLPPAPPPAAVGDDTYRVFAALHEYDKQPLESRVERTDDSSPYWRRETVSFTAAYASDRVLAHLFLPKNARPPYSVVAVMGGSTIMDALKRIEDFDYPFEFIIRSGRAVVIPAFFGTLERGPTAFILPPTQQRDRALKFSMDLGRTIDYLESRADIIDVSRLAFYALSAGASNAVRMVAVEPRVKAVVLSSGGVMGNDPPAVNSWNFAPHVKVPVLMLNGRDDFLFPLELNQKVLFRALGTKEADKRHVSYDGGHRNLVTRPDLIGEMLDWFDKYLGPVDTQR
jgi:formylglycine-generating enzyme required for sulfatase activity/dienelactone hydrolase/predicted Ser/Thr protein kinase